MHLMTDPTQRSDRAPRSLILGPLIVAVVTGAVLAARGTELVGIGVGAAAGFAAGLIAVVLMRRVFDRQK